MPIKLNLNDSKIILHCKGWSPWERREGLIKLYEEIYQYDYNAQGVYTMVSCLFYKVWQALGSSVRHLEYVFENSLPSNAWKVGGKQFGFWYNPETDKFNEEDVLMATTLAMASYFSCYIERDDVEFVVNPKDIVW